jgi:hypothetical protein
MENVSTSEIKRIKITIALPEKDLERLNEISIHEGISKTEALRRSISTEKFFIDKRDEGYKVLLESKDKNMRIVEWAR